MSEESSLFVKIKITEQQLNQFLHLKYVPLVAEEDVTAWWDSREMYHKTSLEAISSDIDSTNQDVIDSFLNDRRSFSGTEYNKEEGCWILYSIFFSENFIGMLPVISLLKQIAQFKESAADDFAMIYDFYWGSDAVSAFIEFDEIHALLRDFKNTSEIPPSQLNYTNQFLEKKTDEFSQEYDD